MRLALLEAVTAAAVGEVPVGAVAVRDGRVLASAHNRREEMQDPTAHAEVLVLRRAAEALGSWRLLGVTVYTTLEPCPMCAGALWAARVERLVFGAADERAGAAGTLYNIPADERLNHRLEVVSGVLGREARLVLQSFFASRRGVATDEVGSRRGVREV